MAAWLYDGRTAERRTVEARADGPALAVEVGGDAEHIAWSDLSVVEARPDALIVARKGRQGWRLGLPHPVAPDIAVALPRAARYGGWIDRFGLWRTAAASAAVSAAVLLATYSLPHWLAPLIPDRWMKGYGDALVGDFGGKFCAGPGGQAALDQLTRRIAPDLPGLNVRVVNIRVVNAATLPGGNIVIFKELLGENASPDEFAGVLAHEIAHVRHRDVAEAMVRELGLGMVVSSLGGNFGGQVHQLTSLSYSRDAEAKADATAIALLRKAGISPAPTAAFFDRLAKAEGVFGNQAVVYLSSHPASKARAAKFRAAGARMRATPALGRDDWDALVDICHNDPSQRAGGYGWNGKID